jgi:hypothetical protein
LAAAFAVTGCGARGSLGTSDAPEDVRGTIVDVTKKPLSGVPVLVGDTVTTTDEAGHFTVHDVSPPYDLAIDFSKSDYARGDVYLGMTDPAPTVVNRLLFAPGTQHGTATLTGVLPAAGTSTIQGTVVVEPMDNLASFVVGFASPADAPAHSYKVTWAGAASISVRLHAFQMQVDPVTKAPLHYIGYDTTDVVLHDQGDVTWSASYKPPPFSESPLSVIASVPEGYTISGTNLHVRSPASNFYGEEWVATSKAAGPKISMMVPNLEGAAFGIAISASNGAATSVRRVPLLGGGTQEHPVHVEPAPTLISPPDSGTLGVGSTVAWNVGGAGTPYSILAPLDAQGPSFGLWGGDGSATVPDLSALGLPLPHGQKYVLAFYNMGPAATVEDLASQDYASTLTEEASTFAYAPFRDITTP